MTATMKTISTHRFLFAAAAAFLTVTQAMAATVILPNGNRIEGTNIRATRTGDIILTTAAGQQTFPKGAYAKAIADKPAEFDQARQLASQGRNADAIQLLEKIAKDFQFLDWDINSYIAIARIHETDKNFKEAVDMYERVMRSSPTAARDDQFLSAYQDALLAAGEFDKLRPMLDKAITSGSRGAAARAQIMRGDIKQKEGQIEAAAMDYLRTAILFQAQKDIQPEALFKAGKALEQLRDPRARDMFEKLVQNYPSSDYAREVR